MWARHWPKRIVWLLLGSWFLLVTLLLIGRIHAKGELPVDYEAYHQATEAIGEGKNLYPSIEAARQTWLDIHQYETDVLAGQVHVGGRRIVGPYVYPPTLALWMVRLKLNVSVFLIFMAASVYGFSWLWLKSNAASSGWLLLVVGSWDVLLSLGAGNVEMLLLFLALLGAWLFWRRQGVLAAGPTAFAILIKPFYAFFFTAFGLLMLALADAKNRTQVLKTLALASAVVVTLIGLDVSGWGPELRSQAATYLSNAMAYQWFELPVNQQTPMSLWNRTLLQGLVDAGWSPQNAQLASLGIGVIMIGASIGRIWGRRLSFAAVFAVAFVMFYWIRPVGWGLPYLEVVMLVTLWPILKNHLERSVLLALAIGLMLSHWLALFFTSQVHGLRLLTLQGSEFTWETWLILPLCWGLLLWAVPRLSYPIGKAAMSPLEGANSPDHQ